MLTWRVLSCKRLYVLVCEFIQQQPGQGRFYEHVAALPALTVGQRFLQRA
jgi:hypothetical protein